MKSLKHILSKNSNFNSLNDILSKNSNFHSLNDIVQENFKFKINRDTANLNFVDECVNEYVNFHEGDRVNPNLNPEEYLKTKLNYALSCLGWFCPERTINSIIEELVPYICFDNYQCYAFDSGELIKNKKVKSMTGNAESINVLLEHIDKHEWVVIHNINFNIQYASGEKYNIITMGSDKLRFTFISSKKNEK